jgi:hypothetical protein
MNKHRTNTPPCVCLPLSEWVSPADHGGEPVYKMNYNGIILGVGAPNESTKHGKSMCAIVLTKKHGFMRIYPIPAQYAFPVWGLIEFECAKGSDPREESYKISSFNITGKIESSEAKREILDACILKSGMEDPMDYQNSNRKSIFLVKPTWGDVEVALSQKIPNISPDDEECGWIVTQGKHWMKPYIVWKSDQGKEHKSHLGGREIYEGIRNNPHEPWNLMNNLQVMNPDYEHWMLMGNMKDKRNVWLCVHLHRLKKSTSGSTPLFSHPIIGENSAWPYSSQSSSNVEIVDGHPTLFTMKNMTFQSSLGSMTNTK